MVIGLTGGIGAGKSAVADFFSRRGATIIDTDVIAREVVTPPSQVLDALAAAFGREIIRADGTLDRPVLAAAVFGDRDREARLNAITHPAIRERTLALIKAQPASANVVVVVPLLFQTGFEAHCDKVVSVIAPRAQRVERVMRRDNVSSAQVDERMAAQLDDEEYEKRADVVIRNDGDLTALERASDDAWTELLKSAGPA
jgi:dephospho-CoA kinase